MHYDFLFVSYQETDLFGGHQLIKTHSIMTVKDKQMYSTPEVTVLEMTLGGVICASVNVNLTTVYLTEEEDW